MQQDVTDPLYRCFWRRKCSYAAEGLQLFITAVNRFLTKAQALNVTVSPRLEKITTELLLWQYKTSRKYKTDTVKQIYGDCVSQQIESNIPLSF